MLEHLHFSRCRHHPTDIHDDDALELPYSNEDFIYTYSTWKSHGPHESIYIPHRERERVGLFVAIVAASVIICKQVCKPEQRRQFSGKCIRNVRGDCALDNAGTENETFALAMCQNNGQTAYEDLIVAFRGIVGCAQFGRERSMFIYK